MDRSLIADARLIIAQGSATPKISSFWATVGGTRGIPVGATGVQWRMLPKGFPKWKSVYHYFRHWMAPARNSVLSGLMLAAVGRF